MNVANKYFRAAAIIAFCTAPLVRADTVSMTLTSAGSIVMGGVYVSPYTAKIDGVSQKVVCDDFAAESYVGESWTAHTSTFTDLSATKWGSGALTQYQQAAWLIDQLMVAPSTQLGYISFAIWGLFTPSALTTSGLTSTQLTAISGWIAQAQAGYTSYTSADYAKFIVYTPDAGSGVYGGKTGLTPQEFIGIRAVPADEASAVALLAASMFGMLGMVYFLRRRIIRL